MLSDVSPAAWVLAAVLGSGLVTAWMVRTRQGSRSQSRYQLIFFAVLALVGASTFAALALGHGWCLASGTTLAAMVLTVTWDLRQSEWSQGSAARDQGDVSAPPIPLPSPLPPLPS